MKGRDLAAALKRGDNVYGTCIISPSPHWVPAVRQLGLDFVFIDTEHIPLDRHELSWMCRTYRAMDIAPIVRIPKPDAALAACALDGGACGIVAPYIETVEQVKLLRGAVKLRPLKGRLLEDKLNSNIALGDDVDKFLAANNIDNILIINVESVPALEALDELLAVPDLDAVLIGPHDLSVNLGIPEQWKHPKFDAAIREIIKKSRAKGVGVGMHYSFGIDEEVTWHQCGANFMIHASDLVAMRDGLMADFKRLREAVGGSAVQVPSGEASVDETIV
eukprot:TRINITY_DN6681_c0_g1_i1.p1 TRINITY_DN6681_c0_g1~~TRINITY_DN6681_c0_g1_i1.p1  ORF type:complete len:277 (+),score=90.23 TRINITY_DN6681_c0_g1_i1:845-1675(+)